MVLSVSSGGTSVEHCVLKDGGLEIKNQLRRVGNGNLILQEGWFKTLKTINIDHIMNVKLRRESKMVSIVPNLL